MRAEERDGSNDVESEENQKAMSFFSGWDQNYRARWYLRYHPLNRHVSALSEENRDSKDGPDRLDK
jgi:hypothetical protein